MEAAKHKSSPVRVTVDSFKADETVSSGLASQTDVTKHKNDPKRSTDFDVELDLNSAVRKAIEKAQESIRIAKESVGRKKKGLQSFSNYKTFKVDGISSHVSSDFMDGKNLLVAKKVIDEINEKISKSTKESSIPVQSCTKIKDDTFVSNSNIVVTQTPKTVVVITITDVLERPNVEEEQESVKGVELDTLRESKENKAEVVSQGSYQDDNGNLDEVLEQKDVGNAESEKRGEEVFEWCINENECDDQDADVINEEGTIEMYVDDCELEPEESANICGVTMHDGCEMKQEDNITVETKGETLNESCNHKFNEKSAGDDKVSEKSDSIDGSYAANNIFYTDDNIAEASGTFQTEDTELMERADASEKEEFCEYEEPYKENDACRVKPDHFRRIYEEAAVKERKRVKNRLAVEKAISEARARAFEEVRVRAERQRAAVEKAIEEARQRNMAEAHEKVVKASVANKSSSGHSKIRAERAAVERAMSEARQHALEKANSQKTVSDLNSSESALRTKVKLEKQNKIMERAAKALGEKEKRDRLAQKEQAERNRLAENIDAEIKRWSNGKEGNLRALLSTLQYILGPESGWQPVSSTDIIATSDVKKAYRKATLCVHPDKLQQWGASIQHQYVCEKVFDLLKVAWKRFNSEERW